MLSLLCVFLLQHDCIMFRLTDYTPMGYLNYGIY